MFFGIGAHVGIRAHVIIGMHFRVGLHVGIGMPALFIALMLGVVRAVRGSVLRPQQLCRCGVY